MLSDKLLLLEDRHYFLAEWLLVVPILVIIYLLSGHLLIGLVIVLFLMIIMHYVLYFKKAKHFNDTIKNFSIAIAFIQELPLGLCISDADGNIIWNNNMITQYMINSRVDSSDNILKLFGQKDTKQFLYRNNGKVLTAEITSEQYIEYSIANLLDSDYYYLIYVKDISDRVFLENSRKIFFGNISHELRIPLTVLRGYIEILETERKQQRHDKSDLKPYKNMQTQVDRLLNMVNQLLTLTKIENNPFLEDQQLVDMPDIIYSIYDEAQIRNNKQKISLYLDDELFVKGHEQSLREVVSNLIYNAIEHNPKNSEIEIRWNKIKRDGQDYALFSIKDNGVGIAKEHINRLTERFYVVNSSRNRGNNKNIGSGLGLAIVKNALKRHDSQLIVESEQNKGSCFKFYLPVYHEDIKLDVL